jgi:hypothetical protein
MAKRASRSKAPVSRTKAKEIMRHGSVRGHELSERQKGLFGLLAGGGKPSRMRPRRPFRGK